MLSSLMGWVGVLQTQRQAWIEGKWGMAVLTVFLRLGLVGNDELLPEVRQAEPLRLRTVRGENRS